MIILCVANNEDDDDEGDGDHIIVIICCCAVFVIVVWIACMAILYCNEEQRWCNGGMHAFMCSSYLLHGSKQIYCLYKDPVTALCTH